jgi:glycosyltransferase involved in cell wall biosynthesis
MKILHVVPSYLPAWRYGGPIRSVHGLARAQAAAGDEVTVFTTDADGPGRLDVPAQHAVGIDGVTVRYFARGFPRRLFRAPDLGRELARRVGDFDVVHLHSVFLWPTRAAARAAERARVPFYVSPRGMLVGDLIRGRGALRKRLWIRTVERRTLAAARGIVLQSELERRELAALGLDRAPVRVVPNGIDLEEIARERAGDVPEAIAALAARGPYVLFLGRLSWKKGLDRLIEAMSSVPGARLVIAGNDEEGLLPQLEDLVGRRGLGGRVALTGEVRGAAKWALLERAAVFCLPSRSENFGVAALEAMAAGRPVVVTPEVGLASFPETTGALVVAGPAELAARLGGLLADRGAAERLGESAARVARASFAWPAIAGRMKRVYEAR